MFATISVIYVSQDVQSEWKIADYQFECKIWTSTPQGVSNS